MPQAHALLDNALQSTLLPAAAAAFGFAPSSLRVNEALVVKYDAASGHNALPVHVDFSLLTLNVALSPPAAYEGGGTWLQPVLTRTVRPGASVLYVRATRTGLLRCIRT